VLPRLRLSLEIAWTKVTPDVLRHFLDEMAAAERNAHAAVATF